ncbi:MAG: 50S ribosomal protein L15e [Candidatus Diapherotrites archaeon]|nr:50S ribosomal protein L15e [Candidatus Diapherotrites archaeon]
MTNALTYIQETFQNEFKGKKDKDFNYKKINADRLQTYRKEKHAVLRVQRPTNLARARTLGYKAKQGFVVARVRVRKGSGMHTRPTMARRPKRMGINKLTRNLSIQSIAEQRAARKFPNCEVLNSYSVGNDGTKHYFEVILIDSLNPAVQSDKDVNWLLNGNHRGRVWRGLTSSGRKSRGLRNKGKGAEKARGSHKPGWKKQGRKKMFKPQNVFQ